MNDIEKAIKRNKNLHRNSYDLGNEKFAVIWHGSVALLAASVLQLFFIDMPNLKYLFILLITAALIFGIGMYYTRLSKPKIQPYRRTNNFHFLGLHDLSDEKLSNRSMDVISRKDEVVHIETLLENTIFPQKRAKQLLCLTGKSGCGKSTILSFFMNSYANDNEHLIYNFSGDYKTLLSALEESFDTTDPAAEITRMVNDKKKIVFILDQFERYFFLDPTSQQQVKDFIAGLCQKNTAVIVSLREEYLSQFLLKFDLNDIHSDPIHSDEYKHYGLLRKLVGPIREGRNHIILRDSVRNVTYTKWDNDYIKNPHNIHILDPIGDGISGSARTEIPLIYCENQNMNSNSIEGKCSKCFGDIGVQLLYSKYKDRPLIEQEIIFHMIEFDMKKRGSEDAIEKYAELEEQEILKRYFDIQLLATGDHFNAQRIMYILSKARLHQISMKTEEVNIGIFADQFRENGTGILYDTYNKLTEFQLIKPSVKDSRTQYEIAHDFIAHAFINYSSAAIDRNVKDALDIYISDYIEAYERSSHSTQSEPDGKASAGNAFFNSLKENIDKHKQEKYFRYVCYTFGGLIILTDIILRWIHNPWTDCDHDLFNGFFPFFIPIHLLICLLYFYQIFDKIFRFYSKNTTKWIKVMFFFLSSLAYMSELFYPYFIIINGIDLALIGLSACILPGDECRETSKNALTIYGKKCIAMGSIFSFANVMFICYHKVLTNDLIILEVVAMTALTCFAHLSHISVEYLYGRRMDVSGKKNKQY